MHLKILLKKFPIRALRKVVIPDHCLPELIPLIQLIENDPVAVSKLSITYHIRRMRLVQYYGFGFKK